MHTDNEKDCETLLEKLRDADLVMNTNDAVSRSLYDIAALGEILIDFTASGCGEDGRCCMQEIREERLRMLQLQQESLGHVPRFLEKPEKICMENSFGRR